MSIERLPFERRPRNSIANNLDRINELVDWVNLDTHLYASASGERVTVNDASSVKGLTVDGRSVQNGTPTPDAPVPVQVVEGANFWHESVREVGVPYTNVGITWVKNADGTYTANGEARANAWVYAGTTQTIMDMAIPLTTGTYTATTNARRWTLRRVSGDTVSDIYTGSSSSYTFTVFDGDSIFICPQVPNGTTVTNETYYIQIVPGTTATPYVPYGSIGIVVGDAATSIDLQGNTLASINDIYRDTLDIDSTGHITLTKRTGKMDVTTDLTWKWAGGFPGPYVHNLAGIEIIPTAADDGGLCLWSNRFTYGGTYMGNRGRPYVVCLGLTSNATDVVFYPGDESVTNVATWRTWLEQHPTTLIYPLTDTAWETIDLGYIDPPAIPSGSVVTISASLTPTIHLDWWVDDGITALVDDLIAYIDYKTEG